MGCSDLLTARFRVRIPVPEPTCHCGLRRDRDGFFRSGNRPLAGVAAKTANRSVLGCMNDMAVECRYAVGMSSGLASWDLPALNRRLRHGIHSPRDYARPSTWPAHSFRTNLTRDVLFEPETRMLMKKLAKTVCVPRASRTTAGMTSRRVRVNIVSELRRRPLTASGGRA
jgi:hypothetical protein